MYNILICDDEADIVTALQIYLSREGYNTLCANSGKEALEILKNNEVHLVLLDIMMPHLDGIETMARVRKNSNIPIILLTAKSEESDKILGLNMGADDYITKPFSPSELMARVRSALRRFTMLGALKNTVDEGVYRVGSITFDTNLHKVQLDGEEVTLTAVEYEILKLLISHVGKVFSTKEIWREVWQSEPVGEKNTIAVHIHHLREKLEINPAEPRYLKVVWGQGYKLDNGGAK